MDTKSSKCVHLVEGGTSGSLYVTMAPMGKTSLGRVIHATKRQKTSFTNLETHGDGSGYLACDTCSSGVPNEIVPAGMVPIGNILVGNNIGFQTCTKGQCCVGGCLGRLPSGCPNSPTLHTTMFPCIALVCLSLGTALPSLT